MAVRANRFVRRINRRLPKYGRFLAKDVNVAPTDFIRLNANQSDRYMKAEVHDEILAIIIKIGDMADQLFLRG